MHREHPSALAPRPQLGYPRPHSRLAENPLQRNGVRQQVVYGVADARWEGVAGVADVVQKGNPEHRFVLVVGALHLADEARHGPAVKKELDYGVTMKLF